MDEEIRANLDRLFKKREHDEDERRMAAEAREANFIARFATVVEDTIAPTMCDFGTYLCHHKGFDYEVIRQEDGSGQRPEITFQIYEGERTNHHAKSIPYLKFYCDIRGEKIGIQESTIRGSHVGQAGDIGSLKVSDITADVVEDYLGGLLCKLLT